MANASSDTNTGQISIENEGLNHKPKASLERRVNEIASISMGLDVFPRRGWFDLPKRPYEVFLRHPYRVGAIVGADYFLIFCALPWLSFKLGWLSSLDLQLYALQFYGALWAAWATVTTKLTISTSARILTSDIIPQLSDATAKEIEMHLSRFDRRRILCISLVTGAMAAIAGAILVSADSQRGPSLEIAFWAVGWWILFTTSASVVIVGQFYAAFAQSLSLEAPNLFPLDPSQSSLILSMTELGRRMLFYWFGIAISIALIFPFSTIDWNWLSSFLGHGTVSRWTPKYFASVDVVTTGFFSFGLGTIVFLTHEAGIRRAIDTSRRLTLRPIEVATILLLAKPCPLVEDDQKLLVSLKEQHAGIAASGSYRSAIASGFSLILPLIPTIGMKLTELWAKKP